MKLHKVVIVGRPNVGKSSLFNRVLKRKAAVVSDQEGVTRDLHYREVRHNENVFELIDTGGFMMDIQDPLDEMVRDQIKVALDEANMILFMADGKTGLTDLDLKFARMVQKLGKPVVLLINKTEKDIDKQSIHEFWRLGMGEPRPISATNGEGVPSLLDDITRTLPEGGVSQMDEPFLRLSILGRPNSGKSTLVNSWMGEKKLIVSDKAGTTRDSIDLPLEYEGKQIIVTDTAGLRKKKRVKEDVEYYSNMRAIESIRRSNVCLLLLDSERGLEIQDLKIIELVQELGKGLVLGLNKWDLMGTESKRFDRFVVSLIDRAPQLKFIPMVSLSGLTGKRATRILAEALQVRENMQKILGREEVIEFFHTTVEKTPHPHSFKGKVVLEKCCQVMVDPPALGVQVSRTELVEKNYVRFLKNAAYEWFGLQGTPLKIYFRKYLKLRTDKELSDYLSGDLTFEDEGETLAELTE